MRPLLNGRLRFSYYISEREMIMNYIKELNAFKDWMQVNELSANATLSAANVPNVRGGHRSALASANVPNVRTGNGSVPRFRERSARW